MTRQMQSEHQWTKRETSDDTNTATTANKHQKR